MNTLQTRTTTAALAAVSLALAMGAAADDAAHRGWSPERNCRFIEAGDPRCWTCARVLSRDNGYPWSWWRAAVMRRAAVSG